MNVEGWLPFRGSNRVAGQIQQGYKVALEIILGTLVPSPKITTVFCFCLLVVVVGGEGRHSLLPKDLFTSRGMPESHLFPMRQR